VGGGDLPARFLSLWRPRPFLTGCSQAAWTRQSPYFLVRNYDYHPALWESVLLWSNWNGRRVIAMTDCLWGVLDGTNDAGLVVALSFGGRRVVGVGFGLPIILRYILEFCATTEEAVDVLRTVPSHMAYNVTLLDASGDARTVQVGPDRETCVLPLPHATNHQGTPDWGEYARSTATLARDAFLAERLGDPSESAERFVERFLEPPLYVSEFGRGWGTLYTAVYGASGAGQVTLRWPGQEMAHRIGEFAEGEVPLRFPG
jgi:predicted choloylglycine hydrolase